MNAKALYFAFVDYEEAPQQFQHMNLNTAPVIYHFPTKGAQEKSDQMDFQRLGIDADVMSKFVTDRTEIHIRVLPPPNYNAPVVVLLLMMLGLGLLYMRRINLEFLWNCTFWGILCLTIVFASMSGQMWNHIRGAPFVMTNPQTRETSFIHGSTQYQLISKTYIVLLMRCAMPNEGLSSKTDPNKRKLYVNVGLGMVAVFFSPLLSIFRSKYHGYTYHFLFN